MPNEEIAPIIYLLYEFARLLKNQHTLSGHSHQLMLAGFQLYADIKRAPSIPAGSEADSHLTAGCLALAPCIGPPQPGPDASSHTLAMQDLLKMHIRGQSKQKVFTKDQWTLSLEFPFSL